METLHNGYIKIAPVAHDSFISTDKGTYQEIGVVLAVDPSIKDIPVGSKVLFDSFMCKKYPVEGKEGEYVWYVNSTEIVAHVA